VSTIDPVIPSVNAAISGDPVADARVAGVGGSGLLTIAALLCALAAAVASTPPALPASGVAVAALILALRARRRPERWTPDVSAVGSTLLLVIATLTADGWAPSVAALFVAVAMYAAFFLRTRSLIGVLLLACLGQGAALAQSGAETAALTWVITTVTVVGTAGLVRWMRETIRALLARLDDAASRDVLTGLLNRRGIFERLEHELARTSRNDQPLTVLVGDLDRFKALNDGLGHAAGDAALLRVGRVLEEASRRTDAVGRLGGDEFVIVLPETDAVGARIHAQRAMQAIAEEFQNDPIPITVTFGAATVCGASGSVERLLDIADRELYAAKAEPQPAVRVAA
jgi:diguanylate cyclase (GGDEF)-like protein